MPNSTSTSRRVNLSLNTPYCPQCFLEKKMRLKNCINRQIVLLGFNLHPCLFGSEGVSLTINFRGEQETINNLCVSVLRGNIWEYVTINTDLICDSQNCYNQATISDFTAEIQIKFTFSK